MITEHIYIDGSKFEANANKYTWVWKKATEKSRYRLYSRITDLLDQINQDLSWSGVRIGTNTEYVPDYLEEVAEQYALLWQLDETHFVHGRGKHKTVQQRQYELLRKYADKLQEYVEKMEICEPDRNSYSIPMFKKETSDKKYHDNPFRAVNFRIDGDGIMHCPNGKAFVFQCRKAVRGNHYGRQEEVYRCEECSGCPYAEQCKRGNGNREIRLNEELPAMHQEVIENLESIQGALLRMNRSIQAEGTFGIMKNDRWYKRIVRRGIKSVRLEVFLVSIGQNLYKYYNKKMKTEKTA